MSNEPAMTAESFDIGQFLPYRLGRLAGLVSADFFATLGEGNAQGWTESYLMAALAREPGLTAREINVRSGLGKVAISRAVAALENAGRLIRTRDAADRRQERLSLSPRGEEDFRRFVSAAKAYAGRLALLCGTEDLGRISALVATIEDELFAAGTADG